jgi:25S rRNA (uracil2843-N3)-methyltransferase
MSSPKSKNAAKSRGRASNRIQQKAKKIQASAKLTTSPTSDLPLELQQLLLNVFQNSFPERFGGDLTPILQEVKGHLYNRDFAAAFGKDAYLEAYAVRWSPSRALGYLKIFDDVIKDYLDDIKDYGDGELGGDLTVACLGGGAGAEIVALAGAVNIRKRKQERNVESALERLGLDEKAHHEGQMATPLAVKAVFVDIANWISVINCLDSGITTAPPLSEYASAAAKASNTPLVLLSSYQVLFEQADILELEADELRNLLTGKDLVTIFFTLNELYTTSMPKTQTLLSRLTQVAKKGSLFLVVDSAGSYSTVSFNGQEKKYPMHWLLDHALLKARGSDVKSEYAKGSDSISKTEWEKLQETESEWFRIPQGLKYPLELENMRYQLHLYRRL